MLLLLPPSETKTRPVSGSVDSAPGSVTSFPGLRDARETMCRAAVRTASMRDSAAKLGVPASTPELVERMQLLADEPVGAPLEVYSGVLYDALGPVSLDSADAIRVLVTSALCGVVDAATDRIPAYRLSASSEVSRLGKVGSWWRSRLAPVGAVLAREHGVVVDGRSGAYRSMMPLVGQHVLAVSPVAERAGKRSVISHDAKRYRGLVARALLEAPQVAQSADEVVDQLRESFGDRLGIELESADRGSTLTVVDAGAER